MASGAIATRFESEKDENGEIVRNVLVATVATVAECCAWPDGHLRCHAKTSEERFVVWERSEEEDAEQDAT